MSVIRNCSEVWSRLFDHNTFLQTELNSFVKEFQENRHDREVENLLDCLNVECEIKNQCNKIILCDDSCLKLLEEKVDSSLQQGEQILKHSKAETNKRILERRKQEREVEWNQFKKYMELKYVEAESEFNKQEENIKEVYEAKENKLKESHLSLR